MAVDSQPQDQPGDVDDQFQAEAQRRMVDEQLRPRGISDPRVLEAMLEVPRHFFVPDEFQDQAYADRALPIEAEQTISQPFIVAYMTQALQAEPEARVLEIGTGSGYQAAILSRLVTHVYTVERHAALAEQAAERFAYLGYDNISIHVGDGTAGWPEHAPYDNAIVTAAGPRVPRALIKQVRRGGTIVLPVGGRKKQQLRRLTVRLLGATYENLGKVQFVPLVGQDGW